MVKQLFLNFIIAGSIYTLTALGFSLIYSTTKFFYFAHVAGKTRMLKMTVQSRIYRGMED